MSVTAKRTRLTDEERTERRRGERELARQAVERLRSSDGWQAWLSTRRHFHTYSLRNQLLIAMTRPTATRVAGFRAWLQLGYAVNKGERAIRIWAPCPPSRKQLEHWRQSGADPASRPRTYFKLAPVFAQDQVQPLPPPAEPAPLEPPHHQLDGEELAPIIPKLDELAAEIGCTVTEAPIAGSAHGYYEIDTGRIVIDNTLSANARAKTRCHELAHALIRRERQDGDPELDRAAEELVVESIAYTTIGALGISSAAYSIPYLASWAEHTELQILEQLAGLVDRHASRIENAVCSGSSEAPPRSPLD